MMIYIRTYTGTASSYKFNVDVSTTIKQLKDQLSEKLEIEPNDSSFMNDMVLLFNGEVLDQEDATLGSYYIPDESMLDLHNLHTTSRNMSLGIRFVDVNNSAGLERQIWSSNAPRWRIAGAGLCLEGKCPNQACPAFDNMVIMRLGYRKFDLLLDPDKTTTICPMCKEYVAPKTCAFANCWWRFEGKQEGSPPTNCSCDWQEADDAYHRFDDTNSQSVVWRQLIFDVTKNKPLQK